MMKKFVTMSGILLLLATTGAYADRGEKVLCSRDNDRQWVHLILNYTKNYAWDDYAPGVAHDGPMRRYALTIVSGWPMTSNLATVTWGGAVVVGEVNLTETDGGTVKFHCQSPTGGDLQEGQLQPPWRPLP